MDLVALRACLLDHEDIDDLTEYVSRQLALGSPSISMAVHHFPSGMAFSFSCGDAAITLITSADYVQYSPVVAGLSDHHFSGFTAIEVSILAAISYRLFEADFLQPSPSLMAMTSHLARGGKTTTVPGKAASTVKNLIKEKRREYGVATTAGLIATMLRRGELR